MMYVYAKIMQTERNQACLELLRQSLSYAKIQQKTEKERKMVKEH